MRILVGTKTGDVARRYKYVAGGFRTYSSHFWIESPDNNQDGT